MDFKRYRVGTILGEETGGNLNDINGGQILFLRLPHSQIEIDFPVMGGFTIEPQANRGVLPDVVVPTTLEDIYQNIDPVLESVKKQIKGQ